MTNVQSRERTLSARGGIQVRDYTRDGRSLPGRTPGSLRNLNFDRVARSLVWVSLGLGLMEVIIPKRIQRFVGVRRGDYSGLIRIAGIREIVHALLILVQPRPQTGVWSRLAGDAMDLGLLGAAFSSPRVEKERVAAVTASIVGVAALDALTATQLNRQGAEERRYSVLTQSDLGGRSRGGNFHTTKSVTINRSPEELYRFWRNFANLPQFMYHLQEVRVIDDRRSHWVTKAPAGAEVEWDAEITEDRPNEMIAWRSVSDADVPNSGRVRFEPHPAGRGTVVRVEIDYRPPAGAIGRAVASLFGEEPGQQVKGDLHRFKALMETGEVIRSDGSPLGLGQKKQYPARPLTDSELSELQAKA